MSDLDRAADIAVKDCMGVKRGEFVLIIADKPSRDIGFALFDAAKRQGAEALFTEILPRSSNAEEAPRPVAELLKLVDAALIPTSMSLTHTETRREASRTGVRIATLPGITEEIMIRTLNADYFEIAKKSDAVADLLTKGSEVHITAPSGTDILLDIKGRNGLSDTGLNHTPGSFSNLPAGEGYVAPLEGKSNGVLVVDGSMAGVGLLSSEVIEIVIRDGYAEEITGGRGAEKLLSMMEPHGREARSLAELGIGTHGKAIITGNVLEDEKVIGTVHLAFGDNRSMGGVIRVASHLDGVVKEPTLEIDGETIIREGKLIVE